LAAAQAQLVVVTGERDALQNAYFDAQQLLVSSGWPPVSPLRRARACRLPGDRAALAALLCPEIACWLGEWPESMDEPRARERIARELADDFIVMDRGAVVLGGDKASMVESQVRSYMSV
jgi:hypothetical protein